VTDFDAEDVAAMREQGDFRAFLNQITGRAPAKPKPEAEDDQPGYHIPRKGAWPCGTAASGPTPAPCNDCTKGTP
jgi:hypothetical protein